jgi:hypothetical protein
MTDIAAGKVPVLKCFEQAWRFLFDRWRLLAPAAVVPALANGLALALAPAGPAEAVSAVNQLTGAAIVAVASVFFAAAVLRKAVRDEFLPPWGLAFGQDETRLFGVLGCFVGVFILPLLIAGELFDQLVIRRIAATPEELQALQADPEALNQAITQAIGQGGLVMLNVFLVASIILMVFGVIAAVRLSMANAASVGERKFIFFRTWSWSKGNVLRMLAALVITTLPAMLLDLIVAAVVLGIAGTGPAPVQAVAGVVTGFIQSLLSIPAIALGAILYQGLRPPGFTAE